MASKQENALFDSAQAFHKDAGRVFIFARFSCIGCVSEGRNAEAWTVVAMAGKTIWKDVSIISGFCKLLGEMIGGQGSL